MKTIKEIEQLTKEVLNSFVGDDNDEITRKSVKEKLEHLLQDEIVQHDIKIVCDESNNAKQSMDNPELICDVCIDNIKITVIVDTQRLDIIRNN